MKRILTAVVFAIFIGLTFDAMANVSDINHAEGGYHNPILIKNDSDQQIGFQFGRFADEQMISPVVAAHSSSIYRANLSHRNRHLFVHFSIKNTTGLYFYSDFKTYDTYLIKSIVINDPAKGYVVTCLDGGVESCVIL